MSKLCSRHFDRDDFTVIAVRRIHRRDAVPRNGVLPDAPVAAVEDIEVEVVTVNDVDLVDEQNNDKDLMANIVVVE
jgi:hypothetical protein